ncbi:MAG: response regulator [Ginsengibacter sp.]
MSKDKKIFIFDDNQELLELCTLILEDMGCVIKTSASAENVEGQLLAFMPQLILMDNWIPGLSGIEATQKIKNNDQLKSIPVIYFSANSNIRDLAERAGADDILAKPFDIAALENMVKKYISFED